MLPRPIRFAAAVLALRLCGQLPDSFHAEVARMERLLNSSPDKAAVTYAMARTWASARQWREAMDWLGKAVELRAGFDPSRDSVFVPLRGTPEFEQLISAARQSTPPVTHSRQAFAVPEGDLMPESLAFDPKSKSFFFGSMSKGKIVRCSGAGKCVPFATGLGVVLGLKIHGDALWALSNSKEECSLVHYELASQRVVGTYSLKGAGHLLNDLAISAGGDVYVSDTRVGAVWLLANGADEFKRLPGEFASANGIAISTGKQLLYVSTFPDGISVIDLRTYQTTPIERPADLCLANIDGLYFRNGTLIAIQNGFMSPRVVRFSLSKNHRSIERFEVLERRNFLFAGVTTGVIAGGAFYYMANIQDDKKAGFNPIAILKLHL